MAGTTKCIVISAVNFTEGGPLTILREFVHAACNALSPDWRIVVFVHDRRLISEQRAMIIEIPYTKRSWLRRLWFEYFELRAYSRQLSADLWVSLHDITPNVGGVRQVVYCHNPAPFYSLRMRDAYYDPVLAAFRIAYKWLYRINIKRNHTVIVQQAWLRTQFRSWTGAGTQILVAHPTPSSQLLLESGTQASGKAATFLYPALPRVFKNMELLCRAARVLENNPAWQSTILLTIDGTENRYSRWLKKKFGDLRSVKFIGVQSLQEMHKQYSEADCLLFPSRLETWGLPITEAKEMGMPMFVANLPYAKESVGNYHSADYIDLEDFSALADKLLNFQNGTARFVSSRVEAPCAPFVSSWVELMRFLTAELEIQYAPDPQGLAAKDDGESVKNAAVALAD